MMTAIYRYEADSDRYESFFVDAEHDRFTDKLYTTDRIADVWVPLPVNIDSVPSEAVGSVTRRPADLSRIYEVPVFSENAFVVLEPLIGRSVEALPLDCPRGRFFLIHILDNMDCLNHRNSKVTRYPSGRIMCIDSYVFTMNRVKGKHIFTLPETRRIEVLVSAEFKTLVEKHGLKGAIFEKLA